ncbi:class II aldolase/adducin family protein [Mesoterricola silvestris]|uniref:Aldolase n=1 Tax=Mesoterricola silvestris TaxID=2927979 RepID=A0AA48KAU1_9BACT|nr:class II aldolase/adducin family protein [Mesoterricola silvestris]BDU71843.1 aldolase [Mesoterricola silvestris]
MFKLLANLCDVCRRLHARNLLAAADGNVSVLLDDGRIAITPSGVAKARMAPADLAYLARDGRVVSGRPSTERLMHLAVYRACPEARAVVHAHPPTAIAFSLAHPEWACLPSEALPEVILAAGSIPFVPYARPGTAAMGEVLAPFLPAHRLMVLARHGALAWGESLEEAYNGMERLEHVCQILKTALDLGGARPLPDAEVEALRQARLKTGRKLL